MADGDFWLISATGDTIDLNGQVHNLIGVQAQPGLTGFGLPPVEVQYQTGAGDGSTFRGQRFSARDIDLPLNIIGNSRADLRARVSQLAAALADECKLQWDDGNKLWELKVRRVGGGEYVYGQDTDGRPELNLTVTLRSGDPLWHAASPSSIILQGATLSDTVVTTIPTSTMGNAAFAPSFKVSGPTMGFTAKNSKGDSLIYLAYIPDGETITFDGETGKVTNKAGQNMYVNLAPSPKFFTLSPTDATVTIITDRSSGNYSNSANRLWHNYITNPTFATATTGWTLYDGGSAAGTLVAYDSTNKEVDFKQVADANAYRGSMAVTVTGLTVGQEYEARAFVSDHVAYDGWKYGYMQGESAAINVVSGSTAVKAYYGNGYDTPALIGGWATVRFTAQATSAIVTITPPRVFDPVDDASTYAVQGKLSIGNVGVVEYGTAYFDGDTPDTTTTVYSWTGTANASVSTKLDSADTSHAKVEIVVNAKNWLVV